LLKAGHRRARVLADPVPLPGAQHDQVSRREPPLPRLAFRTSIADAAPWPGDPADRNVIILMTNAKECVMADAAQVADGFFAAWTTKDLDRARSLLHDDVSFEGPIDSFSDADSYIAALRQLSGIVTGAETQKVFVDGDDVCVIYDLKTVPVPNSRTCEWYRVRDGKIASVSVVFDARPFAAMFENRQGQ